jgi:predicted DCC family thiol-disulfide oxidoreductase YuxK
MTSEITEITEIKEGRSPDRPGRLEAAAPWEKSFRGWILYDGACRSCTASARRFGRIFRRRGFLFLPLQTNWVMKRLELEPGAPVEEMRVLTADGRDIGGAEAVIFLARHIWWAWPFAALARLPCMHKLLNRGYRWIAAHRGCNHIACSLPPQRRWPGWIALIVLPVLALLVRDRVAPWVFMWLIAAAIFFDCKLLTFSRARRQLAGVRVGRVLGYLFLWPGMDGERFLRSPTSETPEQKLISRASKEVSSKMPERAGRTRALSHKRAKTAVATAKILLGAVFLFGLARLAPHPLVTGWIGMIGMILALHFGMFALLAIAWRAYGLDVRPIMDAPLNSTSLGEFWGRRWNGAFNQLAFENVFRPVGRSTGPILGTIVAFLASGLIHELVISLPARTGYGLPTAYFLLQGCGVITQHRVPRIRHGVAGQFFTAFIVAVPAFWLFHPPFVRNVILPFMKAIGAL